MILHRILAIAAVLVLLGSTALAAPEDVTLRPGDKAPALEHVEWLQGEAVRSFEEGKIYVLDFWATWCGPCVASIPHIDELARTRRDDGVTVIGVAIWPRAGMVPTQDFIEQQGDEMSYTIAADIDGATADAYMKASGSNGIPRAMVIDRTGTIAWIGHPMDGLDEVLDAVVDGSFDPAVAAAEREAWEQAMAEGSELDTAIRAALQANDWQAVYENATALVALHERFAGYNTLRYRALVFLDETGERAASLGRELVGETFRDDANQLNSFAWWIVAPDSDIPDGRADVALAVEAAQRANALAEGADVSILDTLARASYLAGDVAAAVRLQEQVIALVEAEEQDAPNLEAMLEQFRKTLDGYRDALDALEG